MLRAWRSEIPAALTRFRRRPVRGLLASLALALGIGTSTAAFSVVDAVLLESLPIEAEDDLAVVWRRSEARDFDHVPFRPEEVDRLIAAAGSAPLLEVAAMETVGARAGLGEGPDGTFAIDHVRVAGDFFGVLGARPAEGRLLTSEDDRLGATAVVVVSHDYWTSALGADSGAVGSSLRFNGVTYVIVGVAPPGFDIPAGADVWATVRGAFPEWDPAQPEPVELDLLVRSAPSTPAEAVYAAVDEALRATGSAHPADTDFRATGAPLVDRLLGDLSAVVRTALLAALLLLAVAIANATLLFLAGGAGMVRDAAVRRALGASSSRVIAPMAADAAVRAGLGIALGLALAHTIVSVLVPHAPADLARFEGVRLDASAFGFAGLLGIAAMVGSAGLAGAWLMRRDPSDVLHSAVRVGAGDGQGMRRAIATGQVALAVVASVGAGLLWQSVRNLDTLDRGFEPEGLYVVALDLPFDFFEVPDGYVTTLGKVGERLAGLPGIEAASATINPPLSLRGGIDFVPRIDGQSAEDAASNPFIGFDAVHASYFDVLRTDVVEGRAFGTEDGPDGDPTIIVNRQAARLLWPGRSPLGRQVFMGGLSRNEWRTVVGVVEDHRFRTFPEARPAAYIPVAQYERLAPGRLAVRADIDAATLRSAVEAAFSSSFPGVRVLTVDAMPDVMARPMVRPRFAAAVFLSFSLATFLLAVLGVHGVFMVLVQERRREIGLRKALGANHAHLVRFIVVRILRVAGVGLVLGIVTSMWTGGLIDALLFGVAADDMSTLVTVALCTVVAALVAGIAPAFGAVSTDPVESLRAE